MQKKTGILLAIAAVAALGLGTYVAAQQDGGTQGGPAAAQAEDQGQAEVAPKAEKALRSMTEFIKNARSLQGDISSEVNVHMQGMNQQQSTRYSFAMQRPNRIKFQLEEGTNGSTFISDGEKLYTYMPQMSMYTVKDAPDQLGDLGERADGSGPMIGGIGGLFGDHPYQALLKDVGSVEYLGQSDVDGASADHVLLHRNQVDIELWIGSGEKPLPIKLVPDMTAMFKKQAEQMPERMRERMKNMKMDVTVAFNNWRADGDLPENAFVFNPPEDAKKVESFAAAMQQKSGGMGAGHPLEGEPAPQAKLDLLGGGQMNLAEHQKNNEVVILDFWATWCGPCRQAMPKVEQVAEEYKDRGVKLYAVNLREEPEQIKQFLESENLDVPVALDREGRIGNAYQARSIPQTVIIGPDGRVRKIFVGAYPDLDQRLRGALNDVLREEDAAPKSGAKNNS